MNSKIVPGTFVVFRDAVDATIYLCVAKVGFRIGIIQADVHHAAIEWQDASTAKLATGAQLAHDKSSQY